MAGIVHYAPAFSDNSTLQTWQLLNLAYMNNGTPYDITSSTTTTGMNLYYNGPLTFSTTTTTAAYMTWAGTSAVSNMSSAQYVKWNTRIQESQDEREARERRDRFASMRYKAIDRRRQRQHKRADKLAGDLLLACMSPEQARQHLELGWFDVTGSRGTRFRIHTSVSAWGDGTGAGQSGNVVLLDEEGKHDARYCVHPPDGLPHADAWLAQKLALEACEDTVLAVANLSWKRAGHVDLRPAARERQRQLQLAA